MFLLLRKISHYSGQDLVLGLFDAFKIAEKAKKAYISKCGISDKWAKQGYHTVDFNKDLLIVDVSDILELADVAINADLAKTFYIVSLYEEGMGQIVREVVKIFNLKAVAEAYEEKMNATEREYQPSYYDLEMVELNVYYFEK